MERRHESADAGPSDEQSCYVVAQQRLCSRQERDILFQRHVEMATLQSPSSSSRALNRGRCAHDFGFEERPPALRIRARQVRKGPPCPLVPAAPSWPNVVGCRGATQWPRLGVYGGGLLLGPPSAGAGPQARSPERLGFEPGVGARDDSWRFRAVFLGESRFQGSQAWPAGPARDPRAGLGPLQPACSPNPSR